MLCYTDHMPTNAELKSTAISLLKKVRSAPPSPTADGRRFRLGYLAVCEVVSETRWPDAAVKNLTAAAKSMAEDPYRAGRLCALAEITDPSNALFTTA
jgi:hypothetical protein